MKPVPPAPPPAAPGQFSPAEVRFSLPELLRDVQRERSTSALASDKIDQVEIVKLFQKNRARRTARNRQ